MEKEPESTKNKSVQPCRTVSTALTAMSAGFQSRWSRGTAFQVCPMTPRGGCPASLDASTSICRHRRRGAGDTARQLLERTKPDPMGPKGRFQMFSFLQ